MTCINYARRAALLLVLLAVAAPVRGQDVDPPNPLASVKSLKCRFPVATAGSWKEGQPQAQVKEQELLFSITDIDVQDATAEIGGTGGKLFTSAVLSGWSLYFVDTGVGHLNVTTVFAQEASARKLKAVHSRHGYIQMAVGKYIAEPTVSQSYGECEIAEQ
jgi:hypothetical protein